MQRDGRLTEPRKYRLVGASNRVDAPRSRQLLPYRHENGETTTVPTRECK